MKFILKSREISEDNEFALLQAKRWWKWRDPELEFVVKYADEEYPGVNSSFEYCPVGSIEFCLANLPGRPKPLNIPPELERYANRIVMTESDMLSAAVKDDRRRVYAKSRDTFKHPNNGFYEAAFLVGERERLFGGDGIQATTDINVERGDRLLVSEWRAFVFKSELVGIKNYSGRELSVPNEDIVRSMITEYSCGSAPVAYTLDVFVAEIKGTPADKTGVMEVHDFFGCGLYGFDRPDVYPFMCNQWFCEWKRRAAG